MPLSRGVVRLLLAIALAIVWLWLLTAFVAASAPTPTGSAPLVEAAPCAAGLPQVALLPTLILNEAMRIFRASGLALFAAFDSTKLALLILFNVPFAAVGGILAIALSGLPLSVAAMVACALRDARD